MSAIAALAISDGAVTHTLNPIKSGPESMWRDTLAGQPVIGQPTVGAVVKHDITSKGLNRIRLSVVVPVLETATAQNAQGYTAAPKVAFTIQMNTDFILPSRSTAAQRTAARNLLANTLVNGQVIDIVDNLNVAY